MTSPKTVWQFMDVRDRLLVGDLSDQWASTDINDL
jgi:hypothetical protein